jgi:glycine/D-amino acid oxidase-like deaminating enzyme
VTLLDPHALPYEGASSTDVSKLVRMDYGTDVLYHELAELALEGWDRWNRDWPRPPYHEDGLLVLSRGPMSPGGFEHESWRVLRERGHEPQRMTADALARRFPAWRAGVYSDGYYNGRAGWAESGLVVERLLRLCDALGVRRRAAALRAPVATTASAATHTTSATHATVATPARPATSASSAAEPAARTAPHQVQLLLDPDSRVRGVRTAGGEVLEADAVVVCAGAWTPILLPWLGDR